MYSFAIFFSLVVFDLIFVKREKNVYVEINGIIC